VRDTAANPVVDTYRIINPQQAARIIEGRPARMMLAPPIAPAVSPFHTRIAGVGIVEPESETIAIATELGGVVRRTYVAALERVERGVLRRHLGARAQRQLTRATHERDAVLAANQLISRQLFDTATADDLKAQAGVSARDCGAERGAAPALGVDCATQRGTREAGGGARRAPPRRYRAGSMRSARPD
jgi:hypothetical protein